MNLSFCVQLFCRSTLDPVFSVHFPLPFVTFVICMGLKMMITKVKVKYIAPPP